MVLEVGSEGCQFNYVVSAHRPTAVQHSAVGHFTSADDLNLVVRWGGAEWGDAQLSARPGLL